MEYQPSVYTSPNSSPSFLKSSDKEIDWRATQNSQPWPNSYNSREPERTQPFIHFIFSSSLFFPRQLSPFVCLFLFFFIRGLAVRHRHRRRVPLCCTLGLLVFGEKQVHSEQQRASMYSFWRRGTWRCRREMTTDYRCECVTKKLMYARRLWGY